ncbi:hypothetical protein KDA06_02540 [Candidatus Saccharibacteria bacterium]|nr:hypothetical protein [Candidatus Saccharibacteria bacterium]
MTNIATGEQLYSTAKNFWIWWNTEPDSDMMLACSPKEAITATLERKGAHPQEARFIAQLGLDSYIDKTYLTR